MTQIDNYFRAAPRRTVRSSVRNRRLIGRAFRRLSRAGRDRHMRRAASWASFHRAQLRRIRVARAVRARQPATMQVFDNPYLDSYINSYL